MPRPQSKKPPRKHRPKGKQSHPTPRRDSGMRRMRGRQPARDCAKRKQSIACPDNSVMIWGRHAVAEALANPRREIIALHLTAEAEAWLADITPATPLPKPRITDRAALDAAIGHHGRDEKPVHQGVVAIAKMLEAPALEDFLDDTLRDKSLILLLDQITDARNIGAMMRTAWALGVAAMLTTDRHAPQESAAMLKAASGAAEHVPLIRVVNLARAMEQLQAHGFILAGLAPDGDTAPDALAAHDRLGIIAGAEGAGLRRLTAERADMLVRIPMADGAGSLNVAASVAIALAAARRQPA